jgi:hypothetical protein
MKLVEYRIFVPFRWDQCRIASAYSVNRRTREETGGGDGFEIMDSGDFEEDGNPGHWVRRLFHFKTKIPGWLRWVVPEKYAHVTENNRNAFPHTITTFHIEGADFFLLHTETRHAVYERGSEIPDNLVQLSPEDLGIREVVYLDLLNGPVNKKEFDLRGFSCGDAGIQELKAPPGVKANDKEVPAWVAGYEGAVTLVVKIVKINFQWKGVQTAVESLVAKNVFYSTYLDTHRAMVKWSTIWSKMTLDEVWAMEGQIREQLAQETFDK